MKNFIDNLIGMKEIHKNLILFVVLVCIICLVNIVYPVNYTLVSLIIILSFNVLLIEHFFSSPKDVLASSITILCTLIPLNVQGILGNWYILFLLYIIAIISLATLSLMLFAPEKNEDDKNNKISKIFKKIVTKFGRSKIQFPMIIIMYLIFNSASFQINYIVLTFIILIIIIIKPLEIFTFFKLEKYDDEAIGEIFGVQSENTFLVKLYKNAKNIDKFSIVEFNYMMKDDEKTQKGLIFDNYFLNEEKWVKILVTPEITHLLENMPESDTNIRENLVYKFDIENLGVLNNFVGIVHENSNIGKINFLYNSKKFIFEGQLLEVFINNEKILYQVNQGTTKIESLKNKDEVGLIIGEAIQLGKWDDEQNAFNKYGWVPDINSPVFIASKMDFPEIFQSDIKIGIIPGSNYPVFINKDIALTHHTAILGVTGVGKSVLARNLIKNFINKDDIKVICVDFNSEYHNKFDDLELFFILSDDIRNEIFGKIDKLIVELSKFPNQRKHKVIKNLEQDINKKLNDEINNFLSCKDSKIAIFELPDVSNTDGAFEYTKMFLKQVFEIAKNDFDGKICIVLEEAHTIVPEINFIGTSSSASARAAVNSIGQIILQGRKYGVGFLVIAQRTANVSKTILTQCNTIISFRSFDKTSEDFLSNHFSKNIVKTIPNLEFRQAVIAGKALRTNVPIILEVPEIIESEE